MNQGLTLRRWSNSNLDLDFPADFQVNQTFMVVHMSILAR